MNLLTRDYFFQYRWLALFGLVSGFTVSLLVGLWPKGSGVMLGLLAVQPFLASPYALRTKIGRVWWFAYACFYMSLVAIYFVGLKNPAGVLCALICGLAAATAVCLRWKPPTDFKA